MESPHDRMVTALKETFVPQLRGMGFTGTFPHFRRRQSDRIDLLTFQFDKWGGGFVIEIAQCPPEGVTLASGKSVPASKVRAWDVHPMKRLRLQPSLGSSTSDWFRYDSAPTGNDIYREVALEALTYLPHAEVWWKGESDPYIKAFHERFRRKS
jgi:hypothetical protein